MRIIIAIMIMLSINSYAEDFELIMSVNTTHNFRSEYFEYNNNNKLVAIMYKKLVVGHMINSFYRESWLFAYNQPLKYNFSVMIGGATGYRNRHYIDITKGDLNISGNYEYKYVIKNEVMPLIILNYKIGNFYLSTSGGFNMISYSLEF